MSSNRWSELQTGIEGAAGNVLSERGHQFVTPFEIETRQFPGLVIELYNALAQAVLTWNEAEENPAARISFLDKHRLARPGNNELANNDAMRTRLADFFGFRPGAAYNNTLSIGTYLPGEARAHLDIGGAALALTRSTPVRGQSPLVVSTDYTLVVKRPRNLESGVWSIKLMEKPESERGRSSLEATRETASRHASIETAEALEREGLRRPYRGGAPEMGNLLKTVKRF